MLASTALSHLTVIDLTRVRAGPTAVRQLADWGAQVLKIEMPAALDEGEGIGGPREDSDFQNVHRNKRGMTLNLKSEEGVAILKKLVERADVVVENFRPDVKNKLGIGYETLAAINPRLIYASISGYGEDGPYRLRPGFDQIAQGMGGLMSITGLPGQGPVRVGIPIADLCAGIFCAWGIAVAVIEREKSGQGQWVKSSLLQAQLFMLDFQAARWLMKGEVAEAGRQQPSDVDPDRRLPDPRRLHERGGLGTQDLGAAVQRDRRARAGDPSGLRHRRAAFEEPRRSSMASSSSTCCSATRATGSRR